MLRGLPAGLKKMPVRWMSFAAPQLPNWTERRVSNMLIGGYPKYSLSSTGNQLGEFLSAAQKDSHLLHGTGDRLHSAIGPFQSNKFSSVSSTSSSPRPARR